MKSTTIRERMTDLREYQRHRRAWGPSSSRWSWCRWRCSTPPPVSAPSHCPTPPSLSLSLSIEKKKTEIRSRPVIRWGRAWNFPAKKARANENCTSVSVCNANERVWNRSHGERERSEMTIKAFSTKLNEAKTLTEWEFVFVVLSEVSHSSTGRRRGFLCRGVFSSSYTGSPHRWPVMTWEIFHVLGYTWTWFLQNKY